jgi:predicted nucleotidyltransferase component of viral defense system
MDILKNHEIFEIEVLEKLNSARLLEPLVFGGGTMLRLCHELNRYSADLDFWFVKALPHKIFLKKMESFFEKDYEITDAELKRNTLLVEIRSTKYPKRLKIEIRRKKKECDSQMKIAYSKFSSAQVMLRAHTLEQTLKNKIEALLDRGEIRDAFDIEFILRRGMMFPVMSEEIRGALRKKAAGFKTRDFKVTLGSVVDRETREYYIENRFEYLIRAVGRGEKKKFEVQS